MEDAGWLLSSNVDRRLVWFQTVHWLDVELLSSLNSCIQMDGYVADG